MSQSKSFYSWLNISVEKYQICSSHQNPDKTKFIKIANKKVFYRYLQLLLYNFKLDLFHQVPNQKPDICRGRLG